jgi:D-sedoheptulose 7-phosphate isomerase
MAHSFERGGRLLTFGSGAGTTDAAHVAVEFMHPVIVGKRAIPSLALGVDADSLRLLGRPDDVALGFAYGSELDAISAAFVAARARGLLTIALIAEDEAAAAVGAEHVLVAGSSDPRITKELQVTTYHVLWELTHVYLERSALPTSAVVR